MACRLTPAFLLRGVAEIPAAAEYRALPKTARGEKLVQYYPQEYPDQRVELRLMER